MFKVYRKIMASRSMSAQDEKPEIIKHENNAKELRNPIGPLSFEVERPNNDMDDNTTFTGLVNDLKRMKFQDVETLLTLFVSKQKEVQNDKQLLLENMIQLLSRLDPTEKLSRQLTGGFVNTLWDERQHPNLSSLDSRYQYRTSDGSYNNVLMPDLVSQISYGVNLNK